MIIYVKGDLELLSNYRYVSIQLDKLIIDLII